MIDEGKQLEIIPPHGGYRKLKSYQSAAIIYDATVVFCNRFIPRGSRTNDQMVQAARSGKQNIAEGGMASATSKKTELRLLAVARASLEELLLDYEDFLRQQGLALWDRGDPRAVEVRRLAYRPGRSFETYAPAVRDSGAEVAANAIVCLIHQANYLLNQQMKKLEEQFREDGGFGERLWRARAQARRRGSGA